MMKSGIRVISMVMFFTFLSKIFGVLRELVLAYIYGTSVITDAYVMGTLISQVVFSGIANALYSAYIPIATVEDSKGQKQFNHLTNNLLNLTFFIILCFSIILTLNAEFVVKLISGNASSETVQIATFFFRLSTIPSSFLIISYIFIGYLQVKSKFVANIIFSIPMNLCIIMGMLVGKNNYQIFAWSYVCSLILPTLLLLIYSTVFEKYKYNFEFKFSDKGTNEVYKIFVPIFIGGILSQMGEIVDRSFAVSLGEGIVSALKFGKLLEITAVSIIAISVGQVVFPKFSIMVEGENNNETLNRFISIVLKSLLAITIPITVTFIIFSKTIIKFVFMHGIFGYDSMIITAISFAIYSIAIPAVSFSEIIFRAFYALKNSKIPTVVFSSCMGLNIILDYLAVNVFHIGYIGLAATTTFVEWLSMLICIYILSKNIGAIKIFRKDLAKIALSSVVLIMISITGKQIMDNYGSNDIFTFVVITGLSYVLYVYLILKLNYDDLITKKLKGIMSKCL